MKTCKADIPNLLGIYLLSETKWAKSFILSPWTEALLTAYLTDRLDVNFTTTAWNTVTAYDSNTL